VKSRSFSGMTLAAVQKFEVQRGMRDLIQEAGNEAKIAAWVRAEWCGTAAAAKIAVLAENHALRDDYFGVRLTGGAQL